MPGTVEAKRRRSKLRCRAQITVKKAPAGHRGQYAGDPKFDAIPGTYVARAVNSGYDVILYQNATTCAMQRHGTSRLAEGSLGRDRRRARCDLHDPAELAVVSGDEGHRDRIVGRRHRVFLTRRICRWSLRRVRRA